MPEKILLTGVAGFVGYHLAAELLSFGHEVIGLDSLNDYYDPTLKQARLQQLKHENFIFEKQDLADSKVVQAVFARHRPQIVVHLAAQAGVRYSLQNPMAYVDSNLVGFMNVLEGCRHQKVKHLIYASSSSVYGGNTVTPFATCQAVDHPVSLYAATKKANELMAHTYSHLYGLPTTGLRFFTVYGPWGRPDMAYFSFTRAILAGKTIQVFNHGNMQRDFTYIDDIIDGIVPLLAKPPQPDPDWNDRDGDASRSFAPYRVYNIGNDQPVKLLDFIETLENCLGVQAKKEFLPMQPGDVLRTHADISDLRRDTGFAPKTDLASGLKRFVAWYRQFYSI